MKLEASFDCEECDGEALSAEYDTSIFMLEYLNLLSKIRAPVPEYAHSGVKAALEQKDARLLYAISENYAREYCAACDKLYCEKHWETFPIFEEGGWCGGFILSCQEGHRKEA